MAIFDRAQGLLMVGDYLSRRGDPVDPRLGGRLPRDARPPVAAGRAGDDGGPGPRRAATTATRRCASSTRTWTTSTRWSGRASGCRTDATRRPSAASTRRTSRGSRRRPRCASCQERKPGPGRPCRPRSEQVGGLLDQVDLAGPAADMDPAEPQHPVAEVAELLLLELPQVPGVPELVERARHLVRAVVHGLLDRGRAGRHPLDVVARWPRAVLEVVPVPRLDALAHHLDSLLGHSRSSIPLRPPASRAQRARGRPVAQREAGLGLGLARAARPRRAPPAPGRACSRGPSHRPAARPARARGGARTGSWRRRSASSGTRARSARARPPAPGSAWPGSRARRSGWRRAACGGRRPGSTSSPSRSEATFSPYGSISPWP